MHRQERSESDEFSESLERGLRNLPPLPVPGDLEARLLAAIPTGIRNEISRRVPAWHRRRLVWAGAGVAFAAACLLSVFPWPKFEDQDTVHSPTVIPNKSESVHRSVPKPPDESFKIVTRRVDRRFLADAETKPFAWPIHEKSPLMVLSGIPRDLLD